MSTTEKHWKQVKQCIQIGGMFSVLFAQNDYRSHGSFAQILQVTLQVTLDNSMMTPHLVDKSAIKRVVCSAVGARSTRIIKDDQRLVLPAN